MSDAQDRIRDTVAAHDVVLFMKGVAAQPQGFERDRTSAGEGINHERRLVVRGFD